MKTPRDKKLWEKPALGRCCQETSTGRGTEKCVQGEATRVTI